MNLKNQKNGSNSNHGVFHSLALLNAGQLESVVKLKPDIKKLGLQYLSDTLSTILSINEYISLEQSAYYHQLAISLVESLEPIQLSELGIDKHEFIAKMIDSNHWLTCTEKKLIAIGDTSVISNISSKHSPVNIPNKLGFHIKNVVFHLLNIKQSPVGIISLICIVMKERHTGILMLFRSHCLKEIRNSSLTVVDHTDTVIL